MSENINLILQTPLEKRIEEIERERIRKNKEEIIAGFRSEFRKLLEKILESMNLIIGDQDEIVLLASLKNEDLIKLFRKFWIKMKLGPFLFPLLASGLGTIFFINFYPSDYLTYRFATYLLFGFGGLLPVFLISVFSDSLKPLKYYFLAFFGPISFPFLILGFFIISIKQLIRNRAYGYKFELETFLDDERKRLGLAKENDK